MREGIDQACDGYHCADSEGRLALLVEILMVSHMKILVAIAAIACLASNALATETTCYGHVEALRLTGKDRDESLAKCRERVMLDCEGIAGRLTGDARDRRMKACVEQYVGKPASN